MSINSSSSLRSPPPSPTISYLTPRRALNDSFSIIEHELASSTQEILAECERLRILLIGKSGAGKSSLINATFKVDDAHVSHEQSGVSDINQEIISKQNSRFVIHDSQGFAAGETQNFETVKKFIKDRAQRPELKDRLHAIWFCMEIPTENGALFETADQSFFELDLENVPVIVVFTKYDLLISKLEMQATDDVDDEEFKNFIRQKAENFFEETCVRPMRAITSTCSYVKVSIKETDYYRNTLDNLVSETKNNLDEHMWILWAIAQRASVETKIDACIEVGRRKYWSGLVTGLHFPGKNLNQCLKIIHDDLIAVWNFNDPDELLKSQGFKLSMTDMVNDLDMRESHHARETIATVSGMIGLITAVIPGAVVIAVPAAAGVAIAQWLFFAYQETPAILQLMMGYIADLTTVLQCLFWMMRANKEGSKVEQCHIDHAIDVHQKTGTQQVIHQKIRSFVSDSKTFKFGKKGRALGELIKIIENVRFKPEEVGNGRPRALSRFTESSFSTTLSTAGSTLGHKS
ncbi:hypothetical protein GYMLUDRAFT_263785 [Collybiopsis luxurians FD-317 M1]|uniref:G domain-containing protein n=1 Tax=Collybiopsis luxurians FD-317 M1 TaxID=944289 RepID=A0A0D0C1W7_9AGAR|nr:hypothetical protein GYMLUDRAFT_263785 [Collybiopsis luxurians FD-317 M1]